MNTTANICWKLLYKLDSRAVKHLPKLFNFVTSHGFIRTWGGISDFSFSPNTLIPNSRFYDLLKVVKCQLGFSERKFPFAYISAENGVEQKINVSFRLYGSVLVVSLSVTDYYWLLPSRLCDISKLSYHRQVSKLSSAILALVEKDQGGHARPSHDPRVYSCLQIKQPNGLDIDMLELIEALTGHVNPTSLVVDSVVKKNIELQIDASNIYLDRQGVVAVVPEEFWGDQTVRRRFDAACGMIEALSSVLYLEDKRALLELSVEQIKGLYRMLDRPRKRFAHSLSSFHMWSLFCVEFNIDKTDLESLETFGGRLLMLKENMKNILIVTALNTEAAPFVRKFSGCEVKQVAGVYVTVGRHKGKVSDANIYIFPVDVGNTSAALNTQTIVSALKPDLVIFSGIAGGRKKTSIGDVVIANHVYNYESAKEVRLGETRSKLTPRPRELKLSRGAGSLVNAYMIQVDKNLLGFDVYCKPIACGEKVIASDVGASAQLISQVYDDSYAIEMEGFGFLSAMHDANVDGILVRGISDLLNNKEAEENHDLAIRNSADVCIGLIDCYLSVAGME